MLRFSEFVMQEEKKKKRKNNPCWRGYRRVPGTEPYEKGSCEKIE